MARDEVPAAVRCVDLRMTMRPRLCSPRSQGWFATSMAAIADRMRAAPSTPLEQEPEYKHHQAVEREDERGSSDVDPPDIRTYRLQPPGEAIARPRHEIVQHRTLATLPMNSATAKDRPALLVRSGVCTKVLNKKTTG